MNRSKLAQTSITATFSFLLPFLPTPSLLSTLPPAAAAQPVTNRQSETDALQISEADRLFSQGMEQANASQWEEAVQSWQDALEIYRELGDPAGESMALNYLGFADSLTGNYQQAIDYYQQALRLVQQNNFSTGTAYVLRNLGDVYGLLGNYQQAIDYYHQSLNLFQENQDLHNQAITSTNLGVVYSDLEQCQTAIQYYQQALPIFQQEQDDENTATVLGNLGNCYGTAGNYEKALSYFQQALVGHRKTGNLSSEAFVLNNIGNVYLNSNDNSTAIDYYQQVLAIFERIETRALEDRDNERVVLANLGVALSEQNQLDAAISALQDSVSLAEEIRQNIPPELQQAYVEKIAAVYQLLAELLQEQGYNQEAQKVLALL